MESATVASAFVISMLQGARDKGYNIRQLLRDNRISPNILEQPGSRVTVEQLSRLSLSLMRLLGDEAFGLLNRPQRPNTFKLACYSAIHGENVGEALTLFAEFSNIADTGLNHSVVRDGATTRYELIRRPRAAIKNNYAIEHLLVCQHRTLCWLANAQLPILQVELDYAAPRYRDEYRFLFFGAPVQFGSKCCSLTFSEQSMRLENVRDIVELKNFLRQAPLTFLTQTVAPARMSAQLRAWLDRQLIQESQVPAIDAAAAHFRLHPQALRRALHKEGTSYKTIKMESRRDLAITLLHDASLRVADIACRLDYSEPRAFIRAFRTWTGTTPLAYRKLGA